MPLLSLAFTPRYITFTLSVLGGIGFLLLMLLVNPWFGLGVALAMYLVFQGIRDATQTRHSILRSFPIAGHIRFILERIGPEIRQYFIESDIDGMPFSRNDRAVVYQRAKGILDKRPFGTELDVYASSFEWLNHTMAPKEASKEPFRITIGGPDCTQPYSASVLNISAMSFGSLSANAIRALNNGARLGNFAHDTGEGSVSAYHIEGGGDIIWELGSGYFGCRDDQGHFSAENFVKVARNPQIKMIEIKLSQGAKPGHGGVLPGPKVSEEIARTRGVPMGVDCISPASHSAFKTPVELMGFIRQLRDLSGGKPIGFKLCVGHTWEFLAICKAMLETNTTPDFIVVDGSEGGTGAAPIEFLDHIGMPLREGLSFVHNALIGVGLRDKIKIGASGKITSAFGMSRAMSLGADWCNSARGFMMALGCIQSLSCHTDHCPTGVATQDPTRQQALVVPHKMERVKTYHHSTVNALAEVIAAVGLEHPSELRPHHFNRRVSATSVQSYAQIYPTLAEGALLRGTDDARFKEGWRLARADSFLAVGD